MTPEKRLTFAEICSLPKGRLAELFRKGAPPEFREMAGWEFKGRNISFVSLLLRIRKFIKGFVAVPPVPGAPPRIDGYNLWAVQNGSLDLPWEPSSPHRHGFYQGHRVGEGARGSKHPNALLLDYSLGGNPWYNPARFLRDYVVQIDPADPTLLLGIAYFALGPLRLFGGYFAIERWRRAP